VTVRPSPGHTPEAVLRGDAPGVRGGSRLAARKVLGWPNRCKLAREILWEYSYKRLKLAQLLAHLRDVRLQPRRQHRLRHSLRALALPHGGGPRGPGQRPLHRRKEFHRGRVQPPQTGRAEPLRLAVLALGCLAGPGRGLPPGGPGWREYP
jgi:hypothetical protein